MKGAIIGDIVGSIYEFHNLKSKDFPLFRPECRFTDDTVMTVAAGMGLLQAYESDCDLLEALTDSLHDYGNRYPHRGYGGRFRRWLHSPDPQPYNSWGNGAPMRCSPAGMIAATPEKAYELGTYTAAPTHNHPEGMKAAGVTAMLIWQARHGMGLAELRQLALHAEIDEGVTLTGSRTLLQQLLSTLLDNAVKYCPEGGDITVRLRKEDRAVLRVANTVGEERPDLDRLFDRFYRSDSSRNQKGGFGIGLSAAAAIVRQHRGEIAAHYEGDTIVFTAKL